MRSLRTWITRSLGGAEAEDDASRAAALNLAVAALLVEVLRAVLRADDVPARCGGDEFCILLPETRLEGARAIAGRIRREVARLVVESDGASLRTTASIGIAVFPDHDGGALRSLLLRADQALYRAKREGRDHVAVFEE